MKATRVVAKIVLNKGDGTFLVLQRSQTDPIDPDALDFPGGRAESGESIIEAVIRETWEETGIQLSSSDIEIAFAKSMFEDGLNKLLVLCAADMNTLQNVTLSEEHSRFLWGSYEEITSSQNRMHHPVWLEALHYMKKHNLL